MTFEFSPSYERQSNGSSERLIQELWRMAGTMLIESRMDMRMLVEEISHEHWEINRVPSGCVNMEAPYTMRNGRRPAASLLLKLGQSGYEFQFGPNAVRGRKFLPRTLQGKFVG